MVFLFYASSDTDAAPRSLACHDGPLHDVSLAKASPCVLGHRGQQMEADEPQMAKSTTATALALLPGGRPWTHGRPLLESLVERLGLASVSHLHVSDPRLPFTRYKCVLRSPVSVTKQYRQHLHLIPDLGQPAGPVVASFSLLRTSVSNPFQEDCPSRSHDNAQKRWYGEMRCS